MVDPVDVQQKVNPSAVPPEDGLSDKSQMEDNLLYLTRDEENGHTVVTNIHCMMEILRHSCRRIPLV
jgi:hypothetical protein